MDSSLPYSQSTYLDLLNSQEGRFHENFPHDSFPLDIHFDASQTPPFSSQQAGATPVTKERKKWTLKDDEVLISAWLNTSKDPIIGNQQKSGSFWLRIEQFFVDTPHGRLCGAQVGEVHCKQRWFKINDQTNKFCGAYATAERLNGSGHSETDVLKSAHDIYYSDHMSKFALEHCWCMLRFEQKWLNLNAINTPKPKGRTKRKTGDEVSHSSSSHVADHVADHVVDHEIRPEGIKAAKAKRNNVQGKAIAEYTRYLEMKKGDMAEKEKLTKLDILERLLAKKEPLSAADEAVKLKIYAQYF